MPESYDCPTCTAVELNKIFIHLRRAEDILDRLDLFNEKIERDFYSIMDFLKEKHKENILITKQLVLESERHGRI